MSPLQSLSTNHSIPPPTPRPLFPIFTRSYSSSSPCPPSSPPYSHTYIPTSSPSQSLKTPPSALPLPHGSSSSSRKRVKLDLSLLVADKENQPLVHPPSHNDDPEDDDEADEIDGRRHRRQTNIGSYFCCSPLHADMYSNERVKEVCARRGEVASRGEGEASTSGGAWRRKRARLGVSGRKARTMMDLAVETPIYPPSSYLDTLYTSLAPFTPETPPSQLYLPSIHPPTGHSRDFSPALSVAFNHVAKTHSAASARSRGQRRLVAVAGEEGGVRIVDVDEGLGMHREEKGWWWRAHGNAVFDVKWSRDDTRIMTCSGDQTTRIHALTTPTPTLLATLRGHTSSVKSAVFFDPTRSHADPSAGHVVATGARDGNILIYDLRAKGRVMDGQVGNSVGSGRRRSERYAHGVPGFAPQEGGAIDPVMVLKSVHMEEGRRMPSSARTSPYSVTSLLALQAMPGVLASSGSSNGVVKLWDLRFPSPTTRSPTPRPTCTPLQSLPDPTLASSNRSASRGINALVESPTTGDIFALSASSRIYQLRPSPSTSPSLDEAVQPRVFTHPCMHVSSFYVKLGISPDGRYLASGSSKGGGAVVWDTQEHGQGSGYRRQVLGKKVGLGKAANTCWPEGKEREVSCVEWGYDMLAACADDCATRVYRSRPEVAEWMRRDPLKAGEEWAGAAMA